MATPTNGVHADSPQVARKGAAPKKTKASPKGFVQWSLHRKEGGEWKRCYWFDAETETRQQMWSMRDEPPALSLIAQRWGSGEYKLTGHDAKGKIAGSAALPAIESENHPARPVYPNRPGSEPKREAQQAPPNPFSAMLQSLAAPAQAQLQMMMQGIAFYQQIDQQARQYANAEANERVNRALVEMKAAQERDRQFFSLQMKHVAQHYEAMRATTGGAASDDLKEELEDLREQLESRGDDDDEGDLKTQVVRLVKQKLSDIPGEDIGAFLKGLGEQMKTKKLPEG